MSIYIRPSYAKVFQSIVSHLFVESHTFAGEMTGKGYVKSAEKLLLPYITNSNKKTPAIALIYCNYRTESRRFSYCSL